VSAGSNPFGAVKTIELRKGASAHLVNRTITYDPVGNATRIVDGVNSETTDYTYDDRPLCTERERAIGEWAVAKDRQAGPWLRCKVFRGSRRRRQSRRPDLPGLLPHRSGLKAAR
jgi:hypothetical protein